MGKSISKALYMQLAILAVCIMVIGLWASRFPYPSPLIMDYLSPQKRWPTQQVADWVTSGNIDDGFMSFFYRDPDRIVPSGDNMVAPADGQIVWIDSKDGVNYMIIALTFWDVHIQRSPVGGTIVAIEDAGDTLMDGEGRDFVYLKEKVSPVQKVITIDSEWGMINVRLITSLLARRLEVFHEVGDTIEKGERLGLIHLGSTVVLDLPGDLVPTVKVGDYIVGGETIMFRREDQTEK